MRSCSKCDEPALPNFAWCAQHRKEYDAERYQTKRKLRQAQIKAQRAATLAEIAAIKETSPCTDCKRSFPSCAMSFDHPPGATKVDSVANLVKMGARLQALAEIAKCDLVCLNCHAVRTESRRNQV